jgi:molybdopterin-guanine dinucleotide biosynthesis protein A
MLTLCIQAGGKSSRMGFDKGLLDFGGKTLIQHLLQRLDSLTQETIITTNQPEGYRFLGLPLVSDLVPERGALGGLYTALHASTLPLVAVVACDMPFASPKILRACRDLLIQTPEFDAVIPSTAHGLEPLHAVYRRETCLPVVKSAIDADQWKMISWHANAKVHILPPDESSRLDPQGFAFKNINTLEEYQAAVQSLSHQSGH